MFRPVASRAMIFGAFGLMLAASCDSTDRGTSSVDVDAGAFDAQGWMGDASDEAGNPYRGGTPTPTDGAARDGSSRWDAGAQTDGAPSLVSVERACAMAAQATCARWFTCAPHAMTVRFGDRAACATRMESRCLADERVEDSGINPTNLVLCAHQVETVACDALLTRDAPASCFPAGGRDDGESCAVNSQCTSGYCGDTADGRCGACAPRTVAPVACSADEACPPGRICTAEGICAVAGMKGAACDRSAPCLPTLSCVEGRCVAPRPLAATCQATVECDALAGALCANAGAGGSVCVARKVALPGQPCGAATPGVVTTCVGGDDLCRGDGQAARCAAVAHDESPCGIGAPACAWPAMCLSGTCNVAAVPSCR